MVFSLNKGALVREVPTCLDFVATQKCEVTSSVQVCAHHGQMFIEGGRKINWMILLSRTAVYESR